MTLRNLLYLAIGNLRENLGRSAAAAFVMAFAVGVVMIAVSLGLGFLRGVVDKARDAYPPGRLVVKPKMMNVSMLAINTSFITSDTVTAIQALPGIEFVAPQLALRVPLHAEADIMGQTAVTDAVVVGIDPSIVAADVDPRFRFTYDAQTSMPLPVVVPRFFFDMYNFAYADSVGLPRINESFLLGKRFRLTLGESFMMGTVGNASGRKQVVDCIVVGLTPNPSLMVGALIPLQHALEFNRWYTGKDSDRFSALHVGVKDLARTDDITSAIVGMGFAVDSQKDNFEAFEATANAVGLATRATALVMLLICGFSVVNTISLIMVQRRGEVGLMRAVGGSRRTVTLIYAAEVGIMALVGGAFGAAITAGLLQWANRFIQSKTELLSFMPENVFYVDATVVILSIVATTALSMLATLPTIRQTTTRPPAVLVGEN